MFLVAAQALRFARTCASVAVFVTRMAFAILVGVLTRRAHAAQWHAMAATLQPLVVPAAGARAGVGPRAREARWIAVWSQRTHPEVSDLWKKKKF